MKKKTRMIICRFCIAVMVLLQTGCAQETITENAAVSEQETVAETEPVEETTAEPVITETDNQYMAVTDEKAYKELAWNYTVESDVLYGQAEGINGLEDLKLDIYIPDKEGPNPAIILLHGGGLTSGDKANESLIKNLAIDYAQMGYVVILPNYRLGTTVSAKVLNNAMVDAKSTYEWVLDNGSNYGINTDYIAFGGYSAGADIAINTYYSNFFTDMERENIKCVLDISGGHVYYSMAKGGLAGCVIIHGTSDTTVDFEKSETTARNLESHGIDVLFHPLEGINHDVLIKYDEIRNLIAEYMYKSFTGVETEINIQSEVSQEYQKTLARQKNGISYTAKQIDVTLDGSLNEWTGMEVIKMDQVKDAGNGAPDANDYSGEVMVAWNETHPTTLYIAATIKDDIIKNSVTPDGKWYMDDCLEIAVDLTSDNLEQQVLKWVIGMDGDDLSVYANSENTTVATAQEGNVYVCELSIDISQVPEGAYQGDVNLDFSGERSIGFSISYNDCENETREHQMGWTSGKASDKGSFGTLYFSN